jgi:amidase
MIAACPYCWPWNVIGWPAINVPAGLVGESLPIGASLLGPANSEPRLVALAAQLEAAEQWQLARPTTL